MNNDETMLQKRLIELATRSEKRGCYEQTDFLNLQEQTILQNLTTAGKLRPPAMYGGFPDAERRVAVFGSESDCGYAYCPNIVFIEIKPRSEKFGETLSHRDYLGAILSLGIKRELTGDICINGKTAYAAALDSIAYFIAENLIKIRHTDVSCRVIRDIPDLLRKEPEPQVYFVASERLDCLVSAIYNLSRNQAKEYFLRECVFINNRLVTDPSADVAENTLISVRGLGRFRYLGINKQTKKGRLCISAAKYG